MAKAVRKPCVACPAVLICMSVIPTEVVYCNHCERIRLRYDKQTIMAGQGVGGQAEVDVPGNCPALPPAGGTSEGYDRSDFNVTCDKCHDELYSADLGGPSEYSDDDDSSDLPF